MLDRDLRPARSGGGGSPRRTKLALAVLLAIVVLTPVLTPATADFVPSPFTDFPSFNTVGEVNKTFIINVQNVPQDGWGEMGEIQPR